nr:malonate decarboxylase holo-ACP synthase [Lysinibacillus timonensis]
MEVKVHDIVRFQGVESLEKSTSLPEWVREAASSQNFGVVRRMAVSNQIVPIGLRGTSRDQRVGTFIEKDNILEVIKPTDLVERIDFYEEQSYYSSLKKIQDQFRVLDLLWGPTGSVGFELATSITVTSKTSDIDLSIYLNKLEDNLLEEVNAILNSLDKKIDIQIEVPGIGAILLYDYIKNASTGFIVRTQFGPQLCKIDCSGLIRPIEMVI